MLLHVTCPEILFCTRFELKNTIRNVKMAIKEEKKREYKQLFGYVSFARDVSITTYV